MIEINLIPDVKRELLQAQRIRAQVISASIMTSIIVGGILVALVLYIGAQGVRGKLADDAIEKGNKTLSAVTDLSKMLTVQNQIGKTNGLYSQKRIDSRIFDVLLASVPPAPNGVQFSQVTLNAPETTITLEGQTRAYDSMETFKKTLDNLIVVFNKDSKQQTVKLANDISIADAGYGEDATGQKVLRFTLSFKYLDELFSPLVVEPVYKLRINGNVTDSYLGIPKSIFIERAKDLK